MLIHYARIAARNILRAPLTAVINVLALALGLVSFVAAYAVVGYWSHGEQHFENADRIYVITAKMALRDGSIATGVVPNTNELYERYLRTDFPEFAAVARANLWSREASISAGDRGARVAALAVDPEFLDIFDLPFVAGNPATALKQPNGILLTEAEAMRLFGTTAALGKTVTLGGTLIDATVTGIIGPIPEPSQLGSSPTASLHFDLIAPYRLYERLRDMVNRPATPAAAGDDGGASDASADGASGETPPTEGKQAKGQAAKSPPQPENWLGGYCCTTYVLLPKGSKLTATGLNAKLKDFSRRHVPAEQLKLASLDVGAVPVSGLMVTQLNAQLFAGAHVRLSVTTLLFALGMLVLIVACVNYANLATARAARRAREIGLRKVIGASRAQVMGQYFFEAGLLTAASLVIALAAVELTAPLLVRAVGIDMRLALFEGVGFWLFLAALLVSVTLLGGVYPALVLSRVRPIEALRLGRMRIGPKFASTLLVGTQFAAASFLLIVVIVMGVQNAALRRTGLGTTHDPYLVLNNFARVTGVKDDVLRERLQRLPQVKGFTEMGMSPCGQGVNLNLFALKPEQTTGFRTSFDNTVGYDYFSTLDIPVIAGRVFDRQHNDLPPPNNQSAPNANSGPPPTRHIVVDRPLAAQLGFASPQAAVGKTVYFPAFNGRPPQPMEIIGVVESHPLFFTGLGATSSSYHLGSQLTYQIVRLEANDVAGGVAGVDSVWKQLAPQLPLNRRFMDDLFNENYERFARVSQIFAGLSVFAFVISIMGLVGMAVQVAGRRRHEIGVRKSVGAHKSQIVVMLLRDFAKPVVVANVIGSVLGYFAAEAYLSVFIFRVGLTPLPFVESLALTLLIAWAAVGSQAWRAARSSPANVLRFE
jgi:putative ABC transport system permease protein